MLLHSSRQSVARLLIHVHPVFIRVQDIPPDCSIFGLKIDKPVEVRNAVNIKRHRYAQEAQRRQRSPLRVEGVEVGGGKAQQLVSTSTNFLPNALELTRNAFYNDLCERRQLCTP